MENKKKGLSQDKTLNNRGTIYITGEEFLTPEKKEELITEIDNLIQKYTVDNYGIHLIIQSIK